MALTSLWQDRHPDLAEPPAGPVELAGHWDVVVVGGGLTGLTTALLLARGGASVVVIEARHLGSGTTGRSTAKVSLLQGTRLSTISRRHPRPVLEQYLEANREGQAWLARFCAEHNVPAQQRTAYTYATSSAGVRAAHREHHIAHEAGLPVAWQDEVALPFPTLGGIRLDDQFQLDPLDLISALARECRAHGVTLHEGVRVRRVTRNGPVRVVTDVGSASAEQVVLATNIPILDRGGFFARVSPQRSYALALRTPAPAVGGMYLSVDRSTRSLRDVATPEGPLLLVGGAGHVTGRTRQPSAHLQELRAWTAAHFANAVETHAWSAQDYEPHHALPYAGPLLPHSEAILVAGGYAKWGFSNGAAAALALAGRMLGGHMPWAEAYQTWGRQEARGLLDSARINAEVGVELTRGWLRPVGHPGIGPAPEEGAGQVRWEHLGRPTAASTTAGSEHRVSAVCTHLGGIVGWNDAERSWDCPLHGSRFGPDGQVLEGPATCGLRGRP